jgi:hypothetical protein
MAAPIERHTSQPSELPGRLPHLTPGGVVNRTASLGYHVRPMAKHTSHILEMARKGAEHRHEELTAEIAALIKTFPHLRKGKASVRKTASVKPGKERAADAPSVQKRPQWSAAAKKAVSLRMKKYWAAKRAAKT